MSGAEGRPRVKSRHSTGSAECPLYPNKPTSIDATGAHLRMTVVGSYAQTWVTQVQAHPPQGGRFLALQTAQASGVGGCVGWRAEQKNWIVGRLDPIRHDKGIVVDLITAGLHCGRGRGDGQRSGL